MNIFWRRRYGGHRIHSRTGVMSPATRALAAIALMTSMLLIPASPASAAATVAVSPAPSASGPTTVTLTGSGFQYQPNAPGGVYVFFGAVSDPVGGSWAPSRGGKTGRTFAYASTSGSQLLIAFEGGSSSEAANGVIRPDGTWTAQMTIPGSSFQATSGNPHAGQTTVGETIDCTVTQCGIITIGAHGMWNANNESFTPISFGGSPTDAFDGSANDDADNAGGPVAVPAQDGQDGQEPAPAEEPAPEPPSAEDDLETAAAEDEESTPTVSWIVIGIFAAGLIALIAAVVVFVLRSRRQQHQPAAVGATSQPTAPEEQ